MRQSIKNVVLRSPGTILLLISSTLIVFDFLYYSSSSTSSSLQHEASSKRTRETMSSILSSNSHNTKPFSLLVTLIFTSDEYKQTFLKDIAPLATYVKEQEHDTIAYEVLESDSDPLQVLILERYRDKENAFLRIHRNSGPFLEFRPKLQALFEAKYVTMQGHSYYDSGVGFGDRVAN